MLYKATKLLQWALAVSIMVIARVEYNVLTLAIFSLDWKIFITSVVYGYCIILTAQVLCLSTLDRAPHQVYLKVVEVQNRWHYHFLMYFSSNFGFNIMCTCIP